MNSPAFSEETKGIPMTRLARYLAAAAAIGGLAAPALAQYSQGYPQQYPPQTYPQTYPQQGYPQQGYGYPQQGYGTANPVQSVIDQLLGNRYNVSDRTAVQQCATAAVAQASAQYRSSAYGQGYPQLYAQNGPQHAPAYGNAYGYGARVTAITKVERRNNGLRVSGTLDSGRYHRYGNQAYGTPGYNQGYGNNPAYGNQGYANHGYAGVHDDLTFRCNVDYRGAVTGLRVRNNANFRRPY
jgi:hypothetical protein